jgi:hypothetical protein
MPTFHKAFEEVGIAPISYIQNLLAGNKAFHITGLNENRYIGFDRRFNVFLLLHVARGYLSKINLGLLGGKHEKTGRGPKPVGIGAHLEKDRRTRGLARGNPRQDAQAH